MALEHHSADTGGPHLTSLLLLAVLSEQLVDAADLESGSLDVRRAADADEFRNVEYYHSPHPDTLGLTPRALCGSRVFIGLAARRQYYHKCALFLLREIC